MWILWVFAFLVVFAVLFYLQQFLPWADKSEVAKLKYEIEKLRKECQPPMMTVYSDDYDSGHVSADGWVSLPKGRKEDIPISKVIHMLAKAAGVEVKLEPRVCTGGDVVVKKKTKKRAK